MEEPDAKRDAKAGGAGEPPSPSPSPSPPPPPSAPQWMERLFGGLRERNRRERDPFRPVFSWYDHMLRSEEGLRRENEKMRWSGATPAAAAAAGAAAAGGGGDGATAAEVQQLKAQVQRLQEEANNGMRVKLDNAEALLRLKQQAEDNEKALMRKEEELEARKAELREAREELDTEQRRAAGLEKVVEVLHGEVSSLRKLVDEGAEKIRNLSGDNTTLLARILTMKNQQAVEMNTMNDMYEKAARNAKLAEEVLERHAAGAAAAGAAGEGLDLGAADSSSILDAAAWQSHFNVRLPEGPGRRVRAHAGQASGARFNASGTLVVSCGADATVRVWDARSGQARSTLRGAKQGVVCASFSPDDRLVLGSGNDRSATVWALNTQRVLHTLTGHTGKIYASLFSGDGKLAVTGSHDRTIRVWDMSNGYSRRTVPCASSCNYLSLGPNGDLMASAHMDKRVRFWSLRTGEAVCELGDLHTQQVTCAQFSSDGNMVATCSRDNSLRLIDVRTYKAVATLREEKGDFRTQCNWGRACFSPDAQYVAAGGADGSLFVWSAKDGTTKAVVPGGGGGGDEPAGLTGVAWNKNGSQVVSSGNTGELQFWE